MSDQQSTDDAACTDCDGTGWTKQTERACACQPPVPTTTPADALRAARKREDAAVIKLLQVVWELTKPFNEYFERDEYAAAIQRELRSAADAVSSAISAREDLEGGNDA